MKILRIVLVVVMIYFTTIVCQPPQPLPPSFDSWSARVVFNTSSFPKIEVWSNYGKTMVNGLTNPNGTKYLFLIDTPSKLAYSIYDNNFCQANCLNGMCCDYGQDMEERKFLHHKEIIHHKVGDAQAVGTTQCPSPPPPPACLCSLAANIISPFSFLPNSIYSGDCEQGKGNSFTFKPEGPVGVEYCLSKSDNSPIFVIVPSMEMRYYNWTTNIDCNRWIPMKNCACSAA
eukprot:TRINITY_DN11121_c0_g1_i1.p1 TRINITY_DN11121_c0_g1~~TRINITY_DN11121_c0_g1_i1.p1  ORF type:complete len:230 (+),score=37.41 TRINITY_DN11121_c0_g1_i1:75-764(+)